MTAPPFDIATVIPQLGIGLGFLVGYAVWSRLYFRAVDPAVRRWVGTRVGGTVVWAPRRMAWGFRLRGERWGWVVREDRGRIALREGLVYLACLVCVNVVAALWPVAVFFGVAFGTTGILTAWAIYPVAFGVIPIYARYWSGRYAVPGMEMADLRPRSGS